MDDGIKFEKSKVKGKKYTAILPDGHRVNFGALGYEHYKDKTPLKLYSNLDHNDKKRRDLYYKRHNKDYPKYSPDWFSKNIYGNINDIYHI
jgi:hypothetical protein